MVLQENVVVAPEELESRHGDDGLRLRWSLVEIGPQQSGIVLDVLEHVHQQEEIGIARCDLPTESQRLGINLLVNIRRIAGVDTGRFVRQTVTHTARNTLGAGKSGSIR